MRIPPPRGRAQRECARVAPRYVLPSIRIRSAPATRSPAETIFAASVMRRRRLMLFLSFASYFSRLVMPPRPPHAPLHATMPFAAISRPCRHSSFVNPPR